MHQVCLDTQRFLLDGEPKRQTPFKNLAFNATLLTGKATRWFEKAFYELHISWYFQTHLKT